MYTRTLTDRTPDLGIYLPPGSPVLLLSLPQSSGESAALGRDGGFGFEAEALDGAGGGGTGRDGGGRFEWSTFAARLPLIPMPFSMSIPLQKAIASLATSPLLAVAKYAPHISANAAECFS